MKLYSDEQLLDEGFRKKVIENLSGQKNEARKREMKKRHEVYKDMTVKWVIQKLKDERLKDSTLQLMANRAANVSICRKVINKLARSYNGGVLRDSGSPAGNEIINAVLDFLDFNNAQTKIDRYRRLFKNAWSATLPEQVNTDSEMPIYKLKEKVFAPWQYDVLERAKDPTQAGCIILSDYIETSLTKLPVAGSTQLSARKEFESYAEQESGGDDRLFIWWSDKYHFTTNGKGQIIKALSPEDLMNPIQEIPGVSYSEDQDGCYWSTGGDDLVDGSILINTLITDMNAIAFIQGWGQYVITGKKIPQVLEGGPHQALVFTYEDGEPEPKVQVVSANPPLDQWMNLIEQYTALLLSTNDLSPGAISMKLDPSNYPSGIAMLIEKSEANNSIEQTRKEFIQGERKQFEIIKKWHNYLLEANQLEDDERMIGPIPEDLTFSVKFSDTKEVITEKEKLETIKLRKELGLNTEIELLMIDNPDLSEVEAAEKLSKIKAQKMESSIKQAAEAVEGMSNGKEESDEEEINEENEVSSEQDSE